MNKREKRVMDLAVKAVSNGTEWSAQDIRGRLRRTGLNDLRGLAIAICLDQKVTQANVGHYFDGRTQCAVLLANRKVRALVQSDKEWARTAYKIVNRFNTAMDKHLERALAQ